MAAGSLGAGDVDRAITACRTARHTVLNISGRELAMLPPGVGDLAQLQHLLVNDNILMMPPVELGQLGDLVELALDGNRLTVLPFCIGLLHALKRLNLSGNSLVSLPAEIGQLSSLTHLFAARAQLVSVPAELCALPALRVLGLHNNELASLPEQFGRLGATLEWCNLSNNRLAALPSSCNQLKRLHTMRLDSNVFSVFPKPLLALPELASLSLRHNQLTTVPDLAVCPSLARLDVRNNLLAELPEHLVRLKTVGVVFAREGNPCCDTAPRLRSRHVETEDAVEDDEYDDEDDEATGNAPRMRTAWRPTTSAGRPMTAGPCA
eukprot:m.116056 g.116056  ORF g.116056 m.116056 type:complete len:322 (-) comp9495_c0_seq1:2348-3313(-)